MRRLSMSAIILHDGGGASFLESLSEIKLRGLHIEPCLERDNEKETEKARATYEDLAES